MTRDCRERKGFGTEKVTKDTMRTQVWRHQERVLGAGWVDTQKVTGGIRRTSKILESWEK